MPSYIINEEKVKCNKRNQNEDKSFKSCICMLLIFITLCAILFLVSTLLQKSKNKPPEEDKEVEYLENYKAQNTLGSNEKIVEYTTRKIEKEYDVTNSSIIEEDSDKKATEEILENITTTTTTESGNTFFTTRTSTSSTEDFTTDLVDKTATPFQTFFTSSEETLTSTTYDQEITQTSTMLEETTKEVEETEILNIPVTTENAEIIATSTEAFFEIISSTASEIINEIGMQTKFDIISTTTEFDEILRTTTNIIESTKMIKTSEKVNTTPLTQIYTTTQMPKITSTAKPEILPTPQSLSKPTCSSNRCKSIASNILYRMDPGQDPCEDFYGFACGGPEGLIISDDNTARDIKVAKSIFKKINKIELKERSKGVEGMVKYVEVCVKEEYEGIYKERGNKVKNIMKSMNLNEYAVPQVEDYFVDMTTLFENMILMHLLPIFDINVGLSFEQGPKFRLELSPPSLYTSSSIFLEEDFRTNSKPMSAQMLLLRRRCFADHAARVPDLSANKPHIDRQERIQCIRKYRAGAFIDAVMNASKAILQPPDFVAKSTMEDEIKTNLIQILDDMDQLYISSIDVDSKTISKSVYELEIEFPCIKWVELFSKLTSKTFNQNTQVYLNQPDLLQKMFVYLQKIPSYKIYNAFLALFSLDLYLNLVESQTRTASITTHCQIEAISLFPHISSAIYLQSIKLLDQEAMDEYLEDIFTQLKKNLTGSLQGADWMDERSKTSIVSSLDELTLYLANDDLCLGETEIGELYKNINISDCYEQNFVEMVSFKRKLRFELFGNEFKIQYMNGFFMNSFDVEPKSIFSENLIAIPVGMVDIYNPIGMPRFLVMAKIGIHVAIELGKRFDPVGITQGIIISSASKPSYDAFKIAATNQFMFNMTRIINKKPVSIKIKSQMSLNSRIADSTAFRLILDAFESFQESQTLPWLNELYTNEQVYIISTIQEFCRKKTFAQYFLEMQESAILPPALRVENMITNTMQFANVFKCPDGAAMNFPMKVQFPYIEKVEDVYEEYVSS